MDSTHSGSPIISSDKFLENIGGDPGLCLEILDAALREGDGQLESICRLTGDSDRESATRDLHSLRGASAVFEATALADLLLAMEMECARNGPAAILPQLPALKAESSAYREGLLRLRDELRGLL